MNIDELIRLLKQLTALELETEWVEFKENNYEPELIGAYISALSNSACIHDREVAYLVFGVQNKTHKFVVNLVIFVFSHTIPAQILTGKLIK